jgi:hypothetical protein
MKIGAAIVAGLLMALGHSAGGFGAEAGRPAIVNVRLNEAEAQAAATDDGSPTAEIPPAANEPSSGGIEEPDSTAIGRQAPGYDPLNPPPPPAVPDLHSLREFLDQMTETSPLGVELREDQSKLKTGERVSGLAIVSVIAGSPAARAGLRPYSGATHAVLEGMSLAAALVFPPAIIALSIVDQTHLGESYDLIIGVDGVRVGNLIEFEDRMRGIKPGNIVYLSVIRDGARVQFAVNLPPLANAAN